MKVSVKEQYLLKMVKREIEKEVSKIEGGGYKEKYIIYPFGHWGAIVKDILNNEYGIEEYCLVDNSRASEDERVKRLEEISDKEKRECRFIVACFHAKVYTEILRTMEDIEEDRIIDVFEEKHMEIYMDPTYGLYCARRYHISLAQWVEEKRGRVGIANSVVAAIKNMTVVRAGGNICEIGAGAGVYTEKLIEKYKPANYRFYEIVPELRDYLMEHFRGGACKVIAMQTDGETLNGTEDDSQDIVFAYSVWPILKYSGIYKYFLEMIRVCKKSGYVIFDAATEETYTKYVLEHDECLPNEWRLLPEKIIQEVFMANGMRLVKKYEFPEMDFNTFWYIYQKM